MFWLRLCFSIACIDQKLVVFSQISANLPVNFGHYLLKLTIFALIQLVVRDQFYEKCLVKCLIWAIFSDKKRIFVRLVLFLVR